jgi:hypothetical protein
MFRLLKRFLLSVVLAMLASKESIIGFAACVLVGLSDPSQKAIILAIGLLGLLAVLVLRYKMYRGELAGYDKVFILMEGRE